MKAITRQRIIYIAGDLLATLCGTLVFNLFRHWWLYNGTAMTFARWSADPHVAVGYIAFPLLLLAIFGISGYYNEPFYKSRYEDVANSTACAAIGALVIYFAIMVDNNFHERSLHYSFLAVLFLSFFIPVLVVRYSIGYTLRRAVKRGKNAYNVLVVGPVAEAAKFAASLEKANRKMGFRIAGLVDNSSTSDKYANWEVFSYSDLTNVVSDRGVKAFVVLSDRENVSASITSINRLYAYGLTILLPLDFYNLITSRPRLSNVIGEPLVDITAPGMSAAASNLKRMGDILFSAVAMVVLIPVYIALAIAIKADSTGPVIYSQERVGLHRRKFKIFKFRSMIVDSEPSGPALSSADDKRVTKLGHILRKYRLDELPQFWNVFRGDMSLVGPRPEREYYLTQLLAREPSVCNIHKIRPGLTSLGTVKYGYAGNIDAMVKRLYYDLLYLENMSLSMDLKIIFHTVNTVITGKGV